MQGAGVVTQILMVNVCLTLSNNGCGGRRVSVHVHVCVCVCVCVCTVCVCVCVCVSVYACESWGGAYLRKH